MDKAGLDPGDGRFPHFFPLLSSGGGEVKASADYDGVQSVIGLR